MKLWFEINEFTKYLNIKSARSQFKQTQIDIEKRYIQENIAAELSDNPIETIQDNLNQLNVDEEMMRRLQKTRQD